MGGSGQRSPRTLRSSGIPGSSASGMIFLRPPSRLGSGHAVQVTGPPARRPSPLGSPGAGAEACAHSDGRRNLLRSVRGPALKAPAAETKPTKRNQTRPDCDRLRPQFPLVWESECRIKGRSKVHTGDGKWQRKCRERREEGRVVDSPFLLLAWVCVHKTSSRQRGVAQRVSRGVLRTFPTGNHDRLAPLRTQSEIHKCLPPTARSLRLAQLQSCRLLPGD